MTFTQKIKAALMRFMEGRHGADNLSSFTLIAGIVCMIISLITGSFLFSLLNTALYVYTIFRMFSRNNEKRIAENRKYIELTSDWKKKIRQFVTRLKNSKQYKYFRCPKCKALLRLTRGCGEVNVTCARCKNEFKQKA